MVETHQEIPDKVLDLEGMMDSKQSSERVRKILSALPARDRELLKAVFLEEEDKDAVCRDIGVDRDYLRVLLHRAKEKFRSLLASLSKPKERQCRDEIRTDVADEMEVGRPAGRDAWDGAVPMKRSPDHPKSIRANQETQDRGQDPAHSSPKEI